MRKYKIYCTSEQTRKALELGAPIFTFSESFADGYRTSIYDKYCSIPPIKYEEYEDEVYADIPTTEEMIGWLEEQGLRISIYGHSNYTSQFFDNGVEKYYKTFDSRKKAAIAVIDVALEYLNSKK